VFVGSIGSGSGVGITNCVPLWIEQSTKFIGSYCIDSYPVSVAKDLSKEFIRKYYNYTKDDSLVKNMILDKIEEESFTGDCASIPADNDDWCDDEDIGKIMCCYLRSLVFDKAKYTMGELSVYKQKVNQLK
jgi:hypothetical protein